MHPDGRRNTVVPESLRIMLGQYLRHPKSNHLRRWNTMRRQHAGIAGANVDNRQRNHSGRQGDRSTLGARRRPQLAGFPTQGISDDSKNGGCKRLRPPQLEEDRCTKSYPPVQTKPKVCLRHPPRTTGSCEHLCNLPAGDRRLNYRFREKRVLALPVTRPGVDQREAPEPSNRFPRNRQVLV